MCCRRLVDYFCTLEPSLGAWGLQVREWGGAVAINVIFAQGHSDHNRRMSLQITGTSGCDFIITYAHNYSPLCQPLWCPLTTPSTDWVVNCTHLTVADLNLFIQYGCGMGKVVCVCVRTRACRIFTLAHFYGKEIVGK